MKFILLKEERYRFSEIVEITEKEYIREKHYYLGNKEGKAYTKALIDDIQIIEFLLTYDQLKGSSEYLLPVDRLSETLLTNNYLNKYFVDFYDVFSINRAYNQLTLSYLNTSLTQREAND